MDSLLSASHISKKYGVQTILSDINLSVKKGEAVALVGANGCGKSTLLRILSGVTRPTGGAVKLPPGTAIGFIPDRYEKINMTVSAFMRHMAAIEGKRPGVLKEYYRAFFLEGMLDTPMKYLSKGTLQKVAVIQALIGKRDILFADEPLSGQDSASQANFVDEVLERKRNGTAVVLACHEPYLIEKIADSIYQIKDGTLIDGTGYMFLPAKPRCVFLLEYHGEIQSLLDVAGDKELKESAAISTCGQLLRLEADREHAPAMFQLFLAENVHIVKFEEI